MRIMTKNGERHEGATAIDVVRSLLDRAMAWHDDERDYMQQVAERVRLWRGVEVDPTAAPEFLESLAVGGLIEFLER